MKKIFVLTFVLFSILIMGTSLIGQEEGRQKFEQPLLITSAGQSAEVQLASVLAKRADLKSTLSKTAKPEDLANSKTLVLVLGVSLKGLGAAGMDKAQEKERVNSLILRAQAKKIPILCLHLGGEARRGSLSDELISTFLPYAKMVIVAKSGNKDRFFNKICEEHSITLIEVERTVDALAPLKEAFK